MKICESCGILFFPAKRHPNQKYCSKKCYSKQYREANKEKIVEREKQYREANKEKITKYSKQYYEANKEKEKEQSKQYYKANKEKVGKRGKQYRKANKEKIKEKNERYYKANKEKVGKRIKQYCEANKEKITERNKRYHKANKEKINKYYKERRKRDIKFRLHGVFSSAIWMALKERNVSKNGHSWEKILKYTTQDLIEHLERQFRDGMNWNNYGKYGWHVDHIKPKSLFDFTSYEDEEFQECWSLENLQPLWAEENLKKRANY